MSDAAPSGEPSSQTGHETSAFARLRPLFRYCRVHCRLQRRSGDRSRAVGNPLGLMPVGFSGTRAGTDNTRLTTAPEDRLVQRSTRWALSGRRIEIRLVQTNEGPIQSQWVPTSCGPSSAKCRLDQTSKWALDFDHFVGQIGVFQRSGNREAIARDVVL
jgi:hypothetical protein